MSATNEAPLTSDACVYAELQEHSFFLDGMDCPACAQKLERALLQKAQVLSAQVDFSSGALCLTAEPSLDPSIVESVATDLGFTVRIKSTETSQSPVQKLLQDRYVGWLTAGLLAGSVLYFFLPEQSAVFFSFLTLFGLVDFVRKLRVNIQNRLFFSVETLMFLALVGALIIGRSFEAFSVLYLYHLGRKLESFASRRARSGMSQLMKILPNYVRRIGERGQSTSVKLSELKIGDLIEVLPGSRLPADGILKTDRAYLDESAITGESTTAFYKRGQDVIAGAVVIDSPIRMQVRSAYGKNTLDRILFLVKEAQTHRPPIERLINRFSRWYTPTIMVLAVSVALIAWLIGYGWKAAVYHALALLLIGCPCAFIIATPVAITSALYVAARRGILIKGGETLEHMVAIKHLLFDKTGTLTQGRPEVASIVLHPDWSKGSELELLRLIASLEQGANHPLARATLRKAKDAKLELEVVQKSKQLPGMGVQGWIGRDFFQVHAMHAAPKIEDQHLQKAITLLQTRGQTCALLYRNTVLLGGIGFLDPVREDAEQTLYHLKTLSLPISLVTGDHRQAAQLLAKDLAIEYHAELLPQHKLDLVQKLKKQGPVLMVGDGINDAPALKAATVGVSMGSGTDLAMGVADATLLNNRLADLPFVFRLSHITMRTIYQNIALALGLKLCFLLGTALGVAELWMGVLADSGATCLVVLNAMRIIKLSRNI